MLFGPVAQLGERTVRIRKVESSILFGSTNLRKVERRIVFVNGLFGIMCKIEDKVYSLSSIFYSYCN